VVDADDDDDDEEKESSGNIMSMGIYMAKRLFPIHHTQDQRLFSDKDTPTTVSQFIQFIHHQQQQGEQSAD